MPMLSILPAFSSPDLKAFPSSAGSYIRSDLYEIPLSFRRLLRPPSLPNLPRAGRARLCDLFRSASATLPKSHRLAIVRIKVVGADVLSGRMCLSRKDPYLPPEPQCVRLLPRPTGLPLWHLPSVSASASRTRKPPSNTTGQRELTDASASVLTSPSCSARRG